MDDINLLYVCCLAPLIGFIGMYAGGFWGVGCGWLIVPTMLVFFDCTPMQAAGIGLLQMVPSIIGTVWRETPLIGWSRGSIGRNLVIPMAAGAFLTSFCGRPINAFFNELCGKTAIFIAFGIFMFFIGVQTVWGKGRRYANATTLAFSCRTHAWGFIGGLGAGVFSSVLGVGGAMVFRPILANGFKVSEIDTARSVRFLLLTTTLTGGLNYLFASSGGVDIKILTLSACIAVGGAIGFPLGSRAHKVVVEAGYSRQAQQSFAIICGIVCTNVFLVLIGFEVFSRYLMMVAAVLLLIFLSSWYHRAKKKVKL